MNMNNHSVNNLTSYSGQSRVTICQITLPKPDNKNIFLFQPVDMNKIFFSDDWTYYVQENQGQSTTKWLFHRGADGYYRIINNYSGCFLSRISNYLVATNKSNWDVNFNNIYNLWNVSRIVFDNNIVDCFMEAPKSIGLNITAYLQAGFGMHEPGLKRLAKMSEDPVIIRLKIVH